MRSYRHWLLALLLLGLAAVALVAAAPPAQAQTVAPAGLPPGAIPPAQAGDDTACRLCHQDTDGEFTLPSGETRSARVDMDSLAHSAHGAADLACTDCHDGNRFGQPHEEPTAADFRAFELENNASCVRCHGAPHITSHEATAENPEPNAVCTDCHGSHDVATVADWPAADQADRCIDCHDASDEVRLLVISSAGLFTDTVDENYCLSCHREDGPGLMLGDDEPVSTQFDESAFRSSVHGEDNEWGEISCRHCHENATPYPHPAVEAADHRDYSLAMSENCAACHDHNFELAQDSVHADALADGDRDAAVCTDCHGFHNVVPAAEPRSNVSQICRQCHSTIYDEYATSVHGDSLLNDENQDVPTCIECHGVHNIGDPTTNLFRIRSPQLCAECHANELLMNKYEISTNVFDSYVADFHGTTVTLFEHQDPNVETNKAVCYDCHGVHAITDPDDPEAGIKANLLETCQQCHPDASENFPDSWTSHFEPSLEHNPIVFLVNSFYAIVIPLTVGGLGFLVVTDVYRRVRTRGSGDSDE